MSKDLTRAYRRHHLERIKRRVRDYFGGVLQGDRRHIGILARTRVPCSCHMCGNPRRWERKLTLKEQRTEVRPVPFTT